MRIIAESSSTKSVWALVEDGNIVESVKIEGISLEQPRMKLQYFEGEDIDLSGLNVVINYSNGTVAYAENYLSIIDIP